MEDASAVWDEPYDMLGSYKAPSIEAIGEFNVLSDNPARQYQPLLSDAISIAESRGLDPGALFFAMLATVSAAIPNGIRLQVDREHHPDWLEPACIWTLLIGAPSTKKSLYHRLATDPLNAYDDRLGAETIAAQADFHSTPRKNRIGAPPPNRRMLIDDVTPAQLLVLLQDNPDRLMLSSEEAANLIGLEPANRSIYNKAFNGEPQRADRKTTTSIKIRDACLSMLLSTHPDIMRRAATQAEHDGYWQRFVPIQLTPRAERHNESCPASTENCKIIIEDILALKSDNQYMTQRFESDQKRENLLMFCERTQVAFDLFQSEIKELAKIDAFLPNLGAHIGKMDKMICRLAMIFHIIKHKPDQYSSYKSIPYEIKFDELKIAYEIVRYYVIPHLYSFHTNYFEDAHNPNVQAGALEILSRGLKEFSGSALKRPKDNPAAIKGLLAAGWIRPVESHARRYAVNPLVFSMIAKKHRDLVAQQMRRPELISMITLSGC